MSAFDLVIGFAKCARQHEDLGRRFVELEKELVSQSPMDEAITAGMVHRLGIEADEPPVLRVLHSICQNDVMRSMGDQYDEQHLEIGTIQRILAGFVDVNLQQTVKDFVYNTESPEAKIGGGEVQPRRRGDCRHWVEFKI